ncbi:MAG TPA: hypothetical protein VHI13_02695 [Candidatus Kapabacteria bacterium]|nr:hypothetical protein [Candidatus Kapabacteria bacterium]
MTYSSWNPLTSAVEFVAPIILSGSQRQHAIIVLEYSQAKKVEVMITTEDSTVSLPLTNCTGVSLNQFRNHDYHATAQSGTKYIVRVKYADGDCNSGKPANLDPASPIGIGSASSTGLQLVDQWRFETADGEAVCGLTIIVIDDIVGPDGRGHA